MSFIYRTASKQNKPGGISNASFDKIRKSAHEVWSVNDAGETVIATRKREETAKVENETESEQIQPGDFVLMFLGGRKAARVIENNNGILTLMSNGDTFHIPQWLVKRAQVMPPAAPAVPAAPAQPDPRMQQLQKRQQEITQAKKQLESEEMQIEQEMQKIRPAYQLPQQLQGPNVDQDYEKWEQERELELNKNPERRRGPRSAPTNTPQ